MRERFALALWLALALSMALAWSVSSPVAASPAVDAPLAQQPEARPGQPIIIRWSTETEVNTAGFNVYRSLDENGPWEKINQRLIPGSPDPLRGGSYVFTDTNVLANVTYWYELEEVELGGRAIRLERTAATAKPAGALAGLPCATGLSLPFTIFAGMALLGRRMRSYGRS